MYKYLVSGPCKVNCDGNCDIGQFDLQPDIDLAEYIHSEELSCIKTIIPTFYMEVFRGWLYVVCTAETDIELNPKQEKALVDYCQGQWSDGWGEGLEQEPFGNPEFYVSCWFEGQTVTLEKVRNGEIVCTHKYEDS